jgi:hypothetical protein
MSVAGKSLWRATAIAVAGLLCALTAFAASPASAATWHGTAHGKIVRSTRLVSGGTSWQGNFWFNVNRNGRVRGHAVVGYEPNVEVSGLNNAIGYVKTVAGTAIGLLGPFGSAASAAGLGQIVGASVSFDETVAVRRGELSGRLHAGELTLRWDSELKGIPYNISFQLVSGSERVGGGSAALRSPFTGHADLVGRRDAVYSDEDRSTAGGVKEVSGSYWVAHRVR